MTAPYSLGRAGSASAYAGTRPPPRTAADYLAIAVGPVLIMVLVGSLNFFLVEIGYRGAFTGQVYWTLFWFTIASVLVSRIAVEHNSAYAALYGLALAAATGLRICAFLNAPLTALLLLASTWWFASKLTWDCTVIDDRDDASGEGLLQVAKLEPSSPVAAESTAPSLDLPPPPSTASPSRRSEQPAFSTEPARPARPHSPGLWLIYFSIGALPIFALGQWTIPIADSDSRGRAFVLCALFVAAALSLLVLTSFLGLRRYLRQRRLAMPTPMARAWITTGTAIVLAVLFVSLLLPRPRGIDALAGLATQLQLHDRSPNASRFAWKRGQAAPGEGRRLGTPSPNNPANPSTPSEASGSPSSDPQPDPASPDAGTTGDSTGDRQAAGSPDGSDSDSDSASRQDRPTKPGAKPATPPTSAPGVPPLPENLSVALRGISLLVALAVAAVVLFRFGPGWWNAWRKNRARPPRPARTPSAPGKPPRPAFAEFSNPFTTGQADRFSTEQLTAYTFNALESWAADAGRARLPDQTPVEFGHHLAREIPDLAPEILGTIRLYVRLAYGASSPSPDSLDVLRRLWSSLRP